MPNTIIKEIQQKQQGSTISNYPIAAMAENIILKDGSILEDALGDVNVFEKGSVVDQIKSVRDMIGVQHYALETNPVVMDSLTLKNSSGNLFYANKDNVQIRTGIPLKANGGVETTSLKATESSFITNINGGSYQSTASSSWTGVFRLYRPGDIPTDKSKHPMFLAIAASAGVDFSSYGNYVFQNINSSGVANVVFSITGTGDVSMGGTNFYANKLTNFNATNATFNVADINCVKVGKVVYLNSFSDTCINFILSSKYPPGRPYLVRIDVGLVRWWHNNAKSGYGSGYGIAWKTSNQLAFMTFFIGSEVYHAQVRATYEARAKTVAGQATIYKLVSVGNSTSVGTYTEWHNIVL